MVAHAHGDDAHRLRTFGVASRWACASLVLCACLAWAVSGLAWAIDLVANLTAQAMLLAGGLAVWWLVRRRFGPGSLCALGVGAALLGLVPGRAVETAPGSRDTVRVLMYNANASDRSPDEALRLMERLDPDVIALLEAPDALIDRLRDGTPVRERLPHVFLPDRAGAGFKLLMTRWPQRAGDGWSGGPAASSVDGAREVLVDRPGGSFGVLLFHPESPRTPARWRRGNQRVRSAAERAGRFEAEGVPFVLACDLNAGPASWRSRFLSRAGLRRAKPFLRGSGTFPSWSVWPLSVAIDDLFVSDGVGVVGWRTHTGAGSDHRAVLVEITTGPDRR